MRNLQLLSLLSTLLLLVTYSSAWPWPPQELVERQNQDANSQSNSNTQAASTASNKATDTGTITANPTNTASNTGTAAGTNSNTKGQTGTATGTNAKATKTKTTVFDPRGAAGGVMMMTPSALAAPSYYKIGQVVTFGWNYTSLSVTPSAINVVASCQANQRAYTIAANQSVGETGAVTWDTGAYQATAPVNLLTETYTLVIWDASKSVTAIGSAGYLSTYNQFTFGMYSPRAYTPLNDFRCATCSGALSDMERVTLKFLFGMTVITVLSFTWFVNGLNLL